MRQKLTAVLTMLCLLLSSCGAAEKTGDFRTALHSAGGCAFTAAVQTEIGGRGYAFTLRADYASGGAAEIEVLAPESIAGIRASMTAENTALSFADSALDFGVLSSSLTSPLRAPWVFGACWDSGYLDAAGTDGGMPRATYKLGSGEDELVLETWFQDGTPSRCELYGGGVLLLSAEITDFALNRAE